MKRSSAGFTLVELAIALVVTSIIGIAVMRVMVGQYRASHVQAARQEMLTSARSTIDFLSAELRAAHPATVTRADANGITFGASRIAGIACNTLSAPGGTLWVVFPDVPFPADFPANPLDGPDWRIAIEIRVAGTEQWTTVPISSPGVGAPACPDVDLGGAPVFSFQVGGLPPGALVRPQSPVAIVQTVSYDIAEVEPGVFWIVRGTGVDGAAERLAGPLGPPGNEAAEGLRFTYYCQATPLAVAPGSDPDGHVWLTGVKVVARMQSRPTASTRQQQTDSVTVFFRNAQLQEDCP